MAIGEGSELPNTIIAKCPRATSSENENQGNSLDPIAYGVPSKRITRAILTKLILFHFGS